MNKPLKLSGLGDYFIHVQTNNKNLTVDFTPLPSRVFRCINYLCADNAAFMDC